MEQTTKKIGPKAITRAKASDAMARGLGAYERFDGQPSLSAVNGYGNPSGATGAANECRYRGGLFSQYYVLGAGETILGPKLDYSLGLLDWSGDAAATEGFEEVYGGNSPRNPFLITVGSGYAKRFRSSVKYEDVSGIGTAVVGWRKQEAAQADWNDYNDLIGISAPAGALSLVSIVGGAATVTKALNVSIIDNQVLDVDFLILPNGRVYVVVEGVRYDTGYVFTAALTLVPFRLATQAADICKIYPTEVEIANNYELTPNGKG